MDKWFTPQERGIILFLILSIIVGIVIYIYKLKNPYFAPELKIIEQKADVDVDEIISQTKAKLTQKYIPKTRKININTASQVELEELPGVGEIIAKKIIDYRNKFGKFEKIEDIMRVKGIGEKKFEKLKDKITI